MQTLEYSKRHVPSSFGFLSPAAFAAPLTANESTHRKTGFESRCVVSTGLTDKRVFELIVAIKAVARIVDEAEQSPDERLSRIRNICQHYGIDAEHIDRPRRTKGAR